MLAELWQKPPRTSQRVRFVADLGSVPLLYGYIVLLNACGGSCSWWIISGVIEGLWVYLWVFVCEIDADEFSWRWRVSLCCVCEINDINHISECPSIISLWKCDEWSLSWDKMYFFELLWKFIRFPLFIPLLSFIADIQKSTTKLDTL